MASASLQAAPVRAWTGKRGRRYEARWLDADGKVRSKKVGPDGQHFTKQKVALAFAMQAAEVALTARTGETSADRPENVAALLDVFLDRHGRTIDPATLKKLRTQLRHAHATFGPREPSTLRRAELEDWRQCLPGGSQHHVFRAFRQACSWAVARDLLDHDPTVGIKNPTRKAAERKPILPFETWTEVERVAAELNPTYAALVLVMAGTGLRPEEAFGLHRSDVEYAPGDSPGGVLHVRRRFSSGEVKPGGKTGEERPVPFGARVEAALRSLPPRIDTQVLFPTAEGHYIEINSWRFRHWEPALRAAGLAYRVPYSLRHTYASWMLSRPEVTAAKLAKMMGTSIKMLDATYSHFMPADDHLGAAIDGYVGRAQAAL